MRSLKRRDVLRTSHAGVRAAANCHSAQKEWRPPRTSSVTSWRSGSSQSLTLRHSHVATRPLGVAIALSRFEVHGKFSTLPVTDVRTLIIRFAFLPITLCQLQMPFPEIKGGQPRATRDNVRLSVSARSTLHQMHGTLQLENRVLHCQASRCDGLARYGNIKFFSGI